MMLYNIYSIADDDVDDDGDADDIGNGADNKKEDEVDEDGKGFN